MKCLEMILTAWNWFEWRSTNGSKQMVCHLTINLHLLNSLGVHR